MARSILTSAKRGAYVAIGLYLAMVLLVSLSAQTQSVLQAPIQVAAPAIPFEQPVNGAHAAHAGAALS
ncbi:hypothetical protein [Pseudomonas sp. MRSN 12121]|uniref:hypothetical protein n=1 Tax=Pseudomonas sp. MRSN 12121 TaxID=1611770 RepID=UPI0005BEF690|nr:hypothetical protein [Pseudomonas sp. MRSN 12121]AJO78328.1 hypothetical protein TO66_13865 [Pseudomonas sp. MRSN 12121]